ncbi:MAG: hypothetical protein JWM02_645 [Frankiales bacterium]|nr:hypothetical protein [Frankiales bacterium]
MNTAAQHDTAVPAALLLLADSRLPAGAHAHSGGLAAAVDTGRVRTLEDLQRFLTGRLTTAGLVAAAVAARAAQVLGDAEQLAALEAEVDARTPSPAAREASRAQGRGLLRAVARAWPSPVLDLLPERPHAPVALGAAAVAVGSGPAAAARVAALTAVTGPAWAAVRLLGLDPLAVSALLAGLAPQVEQVADEALTSAKPGQPLPAASGPMLELLAQAHTRTEVRLFAS